MNEAKEVYKNVRLINKKVRVVILDLDESLKNLKEDGYLNILDAIELLSNRLYDYLPNMPTTAQTIGLNEGEIMDRDNKLLLPTNATMIRPRDRLLLIGKPQLLLNVYNRIISI